jgi:hypothetical protein
MPVEWFSRHAELDDEVAGQILRLGLAPFFAPEADEGDFVVAHDYPGVRAADEKASFRSVHQAAAADASIPTIKRLEAQDGPLGSRSETGSKIRFALESAGVEFLEENGGGAGVRLRKPHRKKA